LTPIIKEYIESFSSGFPTGLKNVNVSFMQSDGGLIQAKFFSGIYFYYYSKKGFKAILSGPAGGIYFKIFLIFKKVLVKNLILIFKVGYARYYHIFFKYL
jgi:N-methylhydantoinase A/oxoprolinase/acetone carboxylase beta subunit